jgi:geranylgeranyl pyrophosphate synthase
VNGRNDLPQPLRSAGPGRLPLLESRELAGVAAAFRAFLPTGPQVEANLRGVLDDTLNQPGSLFRAQLIFAGARRRGVSAAGAREMAVAVEYFHTASLLFDDLPAMDDARERRGFPCAHLRHGEAAAMLGALALVNEGYHLLWRALARLPAHRAARASRLANACLGLRGILDGQSRDLHFQSSARGEAEVAAVAAGKTVTLIRLTLLLPALAGGAGQAELAALERLSRAWGHAYQIADDFKDLLMDAAETGKSARRDDSLGRPNLPAAIGLAAAYERLEQRLAESRKALAELPGLPELRRLHQALEEETASIAGRLPAFGLAAETAAEVTCA